MKIAGEQVGTVDRSAEVKDVGFTIEASATAFEILSAGLYTDRVLAPIRELAANAADAHVDAGTVDTPFIVHIPNGLEPYFSIRDFGTGLSRSDVEDLYTRYFKSTKTQSNDFVGCMGLGSKSPFAYVDSFTVVSYFNGTKLVFNCFKNENNCPTVAMLGSEDTDEKNGMEISFTVQRNDFYNFQSRVKTALRFFKNKPIVKGWHEFSFETLEYMIETPEYGITAKKEERSVIVMGNIAYPFDESEFNSTSDQLTSKERKLVNWGVHLFVPIGAVRVAASREKLTYTPETRKYIKTLLEAAVAASEAEAAKMLNTAKSVWDARRMIGMARKGVLSDLVDFDSKLNWNGNLLSEIIDFTEFDRDDRPTSIERVSTEVDENGYGRKRRYSTNTTVNTQGLRHWPVETMNVSEVKVIFINDLNRGGYAAVKYYMQTNDIKKSWMFTGNIKPEFIQAIDCQDCLVYASKLPRPPRKARGASMRGTSERTMMQKYNDKQNTFENCDVDLEEGGVYIEMRHNKVKRPHEFGSESFSFQDASDFHQQVLHLRTLGFDLPIYGIRPCDLSKINKFADEWMSFDEAIESEVLRHSDKVEMAVKAKTYRIVSNQDSRCEKLASIFEECTDLSESSVMLQITKLVEEFKLAYNDDMTQAFFHLNNYCNKFTVETNESARKLINSTFKVYPMLQFMQLSDQWASTWNEKRKAIIEYVKTIDNVDQLLSVQKQIALFAAQVHDKNEDGCEAA